MVFYSVFDMQPTDLAFSYRMNPTPFVVAYVVFIYGLKKYVEPEASFLSRPRKVCTILLLFQFLIICTRFHVFC